MKCVPAGYIGTMCPARHTIQLQKDGSVIVHFFGFHNHDVQSFYGVNFVNPLTVSRRLCNLVDRKLLSGVTNAGKIAIAVREETRVSRNRALTEMQIDNPIRFEHIRTHELALSLDTVKVINRRNVLGLRSSDGLRMHPDDHKSVWKLVAQWEQDSAVDTPVRYYKPAGKANADTCETVPKGKDKPDFGAKEFLLVMQSKEQAEMMRENSRLIFVDGTHGLTGYGYHLLSIVVVDRHGKGLVVAEAISSRDNHRTWELLATHLRQPGLSSNPEVMMADDTNAAWNGLRRVWKSLKYKLLCHWHIMKNVRLHCCGGKKTKAVRSVCGHATAMRPPCERRVKCAALIDAIFLKKCYYVT